MFSVFCKRVVARFVSRCSDSAAEDQNDRVQEQPHLVSSFDEGVDFVVRHGLPPFRFEHLSLAFEGSEQPHRRADPQGTPETLMVCLYRLMREAYWYWF